MEKNPAVSPNERIVESEENAQNCQTPEPAVTEGESGGGLCKAEEHRWGLAQGGDKDPQAAGGAVSSTESSSAVVEIDAMLARKERSTQRSMEQNSSVETDAFANTVKVKSENCGTCFSGSEPDMNQDTIPKVPVDEVLVSKSTTPPQFGEQDHPETIWTTSSKASLSTKYQLDFLHSTERLMQFAEILYKCKLCMTLPSILTSQDNFLAHVKDFHVNSNSAENLRCDGCELNFQTLEDLDLHVEFCHDSRCGGDVRGSNCDDSPDFTHSGAKISVASQKMGYPGVNDYDESDPKHIEEESDDFEDIGAVSQGVGSAALEIQSSRPKMFNFSDKRTKSRDRKSLPKRHSSYRMESRPTNEKHFPLSVNVAGSDYGKSDTKYTPIVTAARDTCNMEHSPKAGLTTSSSYRTPRPGLPKHTVHWGREPTLKKPNENLDNASEQPYKKIKILDEVVRIPVLKSKSGEENSACLNTADMTLSFKDGDGAVKVSAENVAIPAIHDMQKYSKYLSRKSFFNMAAHQKLKSSAIYNLISTHMQQDLKSCNQTQVRSSAGGDVRFDEQMKTKKEDSHNLSSTSDRLKSFIKHRIEKNEENNKVTSDSDKSDVMDDNETRDMSGGMKARCMGSKLQDLLSRGSGGACANYSSELPQNPSTISKNETGCLVSAATVGIAGHREGANEPGLEGRNTTYKCLHCEDAFCDLRSYCEHSKEKHETEPVPFGPPVPKMEQSLAIVNVIQTLLVATHNGYVSRDALLKEVAKHIGLSQVESWGAACNRAVKEVFPYSQALRKGKYKNTYYFGVKFVGYPDRTDDKQEQDEEKPAPASDSSGAANVQQVKSSVKDIGGDLQRLHEIIPDILAWRGKEFKVSRCDLVEILCRELKEADSTSSSWGWQCNRVVRYNFPEVVIERKGKYKQTYYQGVYYKDPESIKAKLADILEAKEDRSQDGDEGAELNVQSTPDDQETKDQELKSECSETSDMDPTTFLEDDEVTDGEVLGDFDPCTKGITDDETHKALKQRVCRALANTKGPLTTPRAVQKKLNNVSTEAVKAILEELHREGYGTLQRPQQPRGRNKVVFFKSYPGTMREEDLLSGTGVTAEQYKENFCDQTELLIRGMLDKHPQAELMMDFII